jgi:hypothetical protein
MSLLLISISLSIVIALPTISITIVVALKSNSDKFSLRATTILFAIVQKLYGEL